ncbi:glutathione S-transferase [Paraphysoderma sedebokerense]|nr:glutathione S-transferase [Paraphysoderma sedebokerense]
MSQNIKLYFARICPFAHRTTIILHELGLLKSIRDFNLNAKELEVVHIDLANKPEWYYDINPKGTVPTLELLNVKSSHDPNRNQILFESALIAEYLADQYSSLKRLIPETSVDKYRMKYVVNQFVESFIPNFYGILKTQDVEKQVEVKEALLKAIRQLNILLATTSSGPYILGPEFTLGDALIGPFIARLSILENFRGFTVPQGNEYDRFHAYADAIVQRESVKETLATKEELFAAYAPFADGTKKW